MSNPFAARAAAFGLQSGSGSVGLMDGDIDLPPPPPGFSAASVAAPTPAPAAPAPAPTASQSKKLVAGPVEPAPISPNFKPPPGSAGPPPAGGSKPAAATPASSGPPPAGGAKAAVVTAAPLRAQPKPVEATVSPALKAAVANVNAAAPKAEATPAAKPAAAAASGPVPSSTSVKTTLTAQSHVIGGAERGAFGALYKDKPATGAAKPLTVVKSSAAPSSNASVVQKLQSLNVKDGDLPPPPPEDDSLPPPPVGVPGAPPPSGSAIALAAALNSGIGRGQAGLKPTGGLTVVASKPYVSPASPPNKAALNAQINARPGASSNDPTIANAQAKFPMAFGQGGGGGPTPSSKMASGHMPSAAAAEAALALANLPRCHGCHAKIEGPVMELGDGRNFHAECFVCKRCRQPMSDGIMQIGQESYHEACVMCTTCGKNLAHEPFATHPTTGAMFCQQHAKQAQASGGNSSTGSSSGGSGNQRCGGCNQPVNPAAPDEPLISANGNSVYHARCMVCTACRCTLNADGKVFSENGKFYCERDFLDQHGKRCVSCSQVIRDGSIVSIDTGASSGPLSYHPACFACNQCRQKLQGESFYANPKGDGVVCAKCSV